MPQCNFIFFFFSCNIYYFKILEKEKFLRKQKAQLDKKIQKAKEEYSTISKAEEERYYNLKSKVTKSKQKSERSKSVMKEWTTGEGTILILT